MRIRVGTFLQVRSPPEVSSLSRQSFVFDCFITGGIPIQLESTTQQPVLQKVMTLCLLLTTGVSVIVAFAVCSGTVHQNIQLAELFCYHRNKQLTIVRCSLCIS